ncbi:MAG TPA: hypothetical protein VFZ62_03745 [Candidatus Saccharimonadales bacterium]
MCTRHCSSSYSADFKYLRELPTISSNNTIYKKLAAITNLPCVTTFLAEIQHKVR